MAYDISRRLSPPELQEAARVFGPHRQCLQWSFCFLQLMEDPTKLARQTLTAVDLHFARRSTELLIQLGDQKTLRPARDSHLTSVLPDWRRLVQNLFTLYDSDRYGEHRGHQEPDPYEPWTDRRPAGQGEEYSEEKNEGATPAAAPAAATPAAVEIANEKSAPSEPGPELHSGDAQSVTPTAAVESITGAVAPDTAEESALKTATPAATAVEIVDEKSAPSEPGRELHSDDAQGASQPAAVGIIVSEDAEKFFSKPAELNAAVRAQIEVKTAAHDAAAQTNDPVGFIAEIFKPPDAPDAVLVVTIDAPAAETAETTVAFFDRPTMNMEVIGKPHEAMIEQAERVIGGNDHQRV